MGSSHSSHTNLGGDSTSYESSATGSIARWGGTFEVSMSKWKENNDTQVWGVEYKTGQKNRTCGFQLKAVHNNNNGFLDSIHFGLGDTTTDNKTEFALKITRVTRDGLHGGITGIDSSSSPKLFTRVKNDYSIETTIVSYGCVYREGLFVLEMKKKNNGSENACAVNLSHYYVTKDFGLSVSAKISRKGNSFAVEVEGPFKHPSVDLRKVIVKTNRTGIWSPGVCSCSYCKAVKASSTGGVKNGDNKGEVRQQSDGKVLGEIVKHAAFFSSNVKEQSNIGLINSNGYTTGNLNNSIVFIDCNF